MTLSVERLAALREDRPALVDDSDGRVVSYRSLADRAAGFEEDLAAVGVESGDVVVVVSRTRTETLALLFAARRLDAALAPLSYRIPTVEMEALCDRLDPAVVVYERATRDLVRGLADAITFDDLRESADGAGGVDGERDAGGQTPAEGTDPLLYLHDPDSAGYSDRTDYTDDDGYTGDGGDSDDVDRDADHDEVDDHDGEGLVAFSRTGVERNCASVAAAWGVGRNDAVRPLRPLFAPDAMLQATLPTLWAGGTVLLHRAFDPPDALSAAEGHGVTAMVAHPTELRELVGHPDFADADLSTVEWVAVGDVPDDDVADALRKRDLQLVRTHGALAAGPSVTFAPPDADLSTDPACIGRPFPDCEVALLGDDGDPADGTGEGDLAARGPTTAVGTLDDPTAFAGEWVRTGDRARREDGTYWLVA